MTNRINACGYCRFLVCAAAVCCTLFCAAAETISFRADRMSGKNSDAGDSSLLEGNAFIKTKDMEISADTIELSGDDFRFIAASGTVSGKNTSSGLEFTCGSMRYDRESEIAWLEDTVHLIDTENDTVADAQIVEYNQNTDVAVLQIGVQLVQDTTTCTSEFAIYRKQQQLLEMSGNPQVVRDKDTFRAQEITVNLDTEEISLDGRVSGTVTDSGQESEEASP